MQSSVRAADGGVRRRLGSRGRGSARERFASGRGGGVRGSYGSGSAPGPCVGRILAGQSRYRGHPLPPSVVPVIVLAAGIVLAACGAATGAAAPGRARSSSTTSPPSTSSTPGQVSRSAASQTRWPPLVLAAMADLHPVPHIPLEAPASLPGAPLPPNAALPSATAAGYQVSLYHCPEALPVGSPAIGTGSCGAMASVYGSFGGRAFATADAATAEVAPPATPAAPCNQITTVSLGSGVTATVYAADGSPLACEVTWARGPWTFVLEGAPTRLPNGLAPTTSSTPSSASVPSGGIPWGPVATAILAQVARTPLPAAPGVLVADLAPDGVHTTLRWAIGEAVYLVGVEHGAAQAVALASAMRAYPG